MGSSELAPSGSNVSPDCARVNCVNVHIHQISGTDCGGRTKMDRLLVALRRPRWMPTSTGTARTWHMLSIYYSKRD
eukprot:4362549-Heterocapsa_arctica.AAC.1